jgi:Tfp pilus assembly protein PilV
MKHLRHSEGFTLFEVLCAVVLLAGAIMSMAALTDTIIIGNHYSNQLTTATTLAQDRMEDIRKQGYNGLPNASDNTITESAGSIAGYPGYERVTDIDVANPEPNMMAVTVTVSWDSGGYSVVLKTILAETE